ncbi:NRDE protein-domain-containing protein [Spinellus fusiger]|nr:NRDE protein-domain-containing protein [Spinellus fusiger]
MCTLFWAVRYHPRYRFVFASNRDERIARPSIRADFWPKPHQDILSGIDMEPGATPLQNGTWVGITRQGRFSALTNIAETSLNTKLSRGLLTSNFLTLAGGLSVEDYMKQLKKEADDYRGFNLVCMDLSKHQQNEESAMFYYSNRCDTPITPLAQGACYGLSNSTLHQPWPKVDHGTDVFRSILNPKKELSEATLINDLFDMLRTGTTLEKTPQTEEPLTLEQIREKVKGSIFVPLLPTSDDRFSMLSVTRTSTVILIDHNGNTVFVEREIYDKKMDEQGIPTYELKEEMPGQDVYFRFNIDDDC